MGIEIRDIVWLAVTTLLATYQIGATFIRKVVKSRQKHKIEPPATTGNDEFERVYRAHQNTLEFFPMFLSVMWVSGVFFHQVPASVAGVYYMLGRHRYFNGYSKDAKQRVPGFMMCVQALKALMAMSALGVGHNLLLNYCELDLKAYLPKTIQL